MTQPLHIANVCTITLSNRDRRVWCGTGSWPSRCGHGVWMRQRRGNPTVDRTRCTVGAVVVLQYCLLAANQASTLALSPRPRPLADLFRSSAVQPVRRRLNAPASPTLMNVIQSAPSVGPFFSGGGLTFTSDAPL